MIRLINNVCGDGKGLWVKPVKGGVTINMGESLQHMTKGTISLVAYPIIGYVKATIHRVHTPRDDQLDYEHLGRICACTVGVNLTSRLRLK